MNARVAVLMALAGCTQNAPQTPNGQQTPVVDRTAPVQVTIVNRRASSVWIPSQNECEHSPIFVTGADGARAEIYAGQTLGCQAVRQGDCPDFGSCPGPSAFKLDPGQSLSATWSGHLLADRTLSPSEVGPNCPSNCLESLPASGTFVVRAEAWSACAGDCPCEGGGLACPVPEQLAGKPTDLSAIARVTMPGAGPVEIVFK